MQILTCLAAFFLLAFTAAAQPVFQEYIFNAGVRPKISTTSDGNYLIAYSGFAESPSGIMWVRPNGEVLTTVEYPSVNLDEAKQINDSTLAIVYNRPDGSIAFGFTDLLGNQFIEKALPCGTEAGCGGGFILPKEGGQFNLCYYLDGESNSNYNKLMLVDINGTILKQADINLNGGATDPHAFRLRDDGSITAVFRTNDQAPQKGYFFNYSPNLELSWSQVYWDTTETEKPDHILTSMAATQDGGYLAVGYFADTVGYLLKTDSLANYQWSKTWSAPFGNYTRFYTVERNDNGDFYAAGVVGFDTPIMVLLKFDATGGIIWSTYLDGLSHLWPSSIQLDAVGNPVIIGTTSANDWVPYIYLATITQEATSIVESQKLIFEFDLLPNPAKDRITIKPLGELFFDKIRLTIRSVEGKLVNVVNKEQVVFGNPMELDISYLPPGHYFVEIGIEGHAPSIKHFVKM